MSAYDYVFGWEGGDSPAGGWSHLRVVRFRGAEALSAPSQYEIHLLSAKGESDPDPRELSGAKASLRIATLTEPRLKLMHGIITEAEEVRDLPEGTLYRVVLEAPFARLRYTKRHRVFVDKSIRQIIEEVFSKASVSHDGEAKSPEITDADFKAAVFEFGVRLQDSGRFDDARARPFTVQYGESDFAFISRLLEEEGLSYHFENGDARCLLVISDSDAGRISLEDPAVGTGIDGREVRTFRLASAIRPTHVSFGEYNFKNPALPMEAKAGADPSISDYRFPGGYLHDSANGEPLVRAALERHDSERETGVGRGTLRILSAGTIVKLEHAKSRYEGEYLVTGLRIDARAEGVLASTQDFNHGAPWEVTFDVAPRGRGGDVSDSRWRPARVTPKPRTQGLQTAVVTAEPGASGSEINLGDQPDLGNVRVRFHWDRDADRLAKEPSSTWVRVSEPFARPGHGGVWHARVGVEVLVDFEEGDPDRPVILGRVYNAVNRPPKTRPTDSTFYSFTTPGGGTHNEITFEDAAGTERIYTNAAKDMDVNVNAVRTENVGGNAVMTVGANDTETVAASNADTVGANDMMSIGANQTKTIGANRTRIVGANRTKIVGAAETRTIAANSTNIVGGPLTEAVGGAVSEQYGATRTTSVAANLTEVCGASKTTKVGGLVFQSYGASQFVVAGGSRNIKVGAMYGQLIGGSRTDIYGGSLSTDVAGPHLIIAGGGITQTVSGAWMLTAPLKLTVVGVSTSIIGSSKSANAATLSVTGLSLSATGMSSTLGGVALNMTGVNLKGSAITAKAGAAKSVLVGIAVIPAGCHLRL